MPVKSVPILEILHQSSRVINLLNALSMHSRYLTERNVPSKWVFCTTSGGQLSSSQAAAIFRRLTKTTATCMRKSVAIAVSSHCFCLLQSTCKKNGRVENFIKKLTFVNKTRLIAVKTIKTDIECLVLVIRNRFRNFRSKNYMIKNRGV